MLSRYRILERVGAGGVGVVYRAEDLELKRNVAVKFLSEESFEKEHARARFHREARLAASLNHPNICTVHEVGESTEGDEKLLGGDPEIRPGTPFIVMELIEGQPLDEILERDGPLPLSRLLEIAVQVADGLAEAHASSIVHRDLKPKNVMVAPSGRVKILDFGMAKPLVPAERDDKLMRTTEQSSLELTREGMVFGTVAYMSPEQASGKPLDSRSDVFSFGVMLYEMAAGSRPFEGDSLTSTLAKILETEPGLLTESRPDMLPELSRIIHRCLRKNREDRYNDTRDLAVTLRDLLQEISSGAVRKLVPTADGPSAGAGRTRRRTVVRTVAVGGLVLAVGALVFLLSRWFPQSSQSAPPAFRQLTFTGSASYPTLSPDGQSLAYVTGRRDGGYQVVIQDLIGKQELPIFEAGWIRSLRWSPGGTELLVTGGSTDDGGQTHLISRLGGTTRPLPYYPFVAWSPDGKRFAGATLEGKRIYFTETATGAVSAVELTGSFAFVYEIDWSPAGRLLTLRTGDREGRQAIRTTSTDGGDQRVLVEGSALLHSPRFSARGDAIYYLSGEAQARELSKIEIDADSGEPESEPTLLLSGLQAGDRMTLSGDGKRLLYTREVSHTNLWLLKRSPDGAGVTPQQLTYGTFRHGAPRFSPDGTRLALIRTSGSNPNVFVMALGGEPARQLTFLAGDVWKPVWSPDGEEIAFGSTMGDSPRVWKIDSRGGTPQPFNNSHLSRDLAWAPGSEIVYQRPGNSAFHLLDPRGGDERVFTGDSGAGSAAADPLQFFSWMASPEYSPDGRWVAFTCDCPEGEGVWVASVRGSSRRLIHDDGQTVPVGWSADGTAVLALDPETRRLLRLPARGGPASTWLEIPFDQIGDMDVVPGGSGIACSVPVTQADIWLIENFDPGS